METQDLITRLESAYDELEISKSQQDSINAHLHLLLLKDSPTYEHCVRVGLLGKEVAQYSKIIELSLNKR